MIHFVTQTQTSPVAKQPSPWPAIGGGFLALGAASSILPTIFRDATGLTSPAYDFLQAVGITSMALALVILSAVAFRFVFHANRRATVR
jgi:hypothetical protein